MQTNFFTKAKDYFLNHKKRSIAIIIVLVIIGYYSYSKLTSTAGDTTYMLGTVEKKTIVSSITGSGQVSTARTLDLKPQASANVVYIGVKPGDVVKEGQLLVELDPTNAQKSVRDAQANLDGAKISLAKIQQPSDSLSILQAQNALAQANSDLASAYASGQNAISSSFLDLPTAITGLDSTLHGFDVAPAGTGQINIQYYGDAAKNFESASSAGKAELYKNDAEQKYQLARTAYDKNFSDFKNFSSSSDTSTINTMIEETYSTTKLMIDAVKSATNIIQYYQDTTTSAGKTPVSKSNSQLSILSGYTNSINTDSGNLLTIKNRIASDTTAIPEKQASLKKLQDGSDPLDIQTAQLSVTKAENSLLDAKSTLSYYYVRAPFSGTVSNIPVKIGDPAGTSTTVASLIANEQVVTIPLNEVDVSKVSVGEKATFTFDAIDGLTLTGKVAQIDTVGTVTQGVVNYTVTITFDSSDPRVKPGMSTTASIITQVHPDVLTIPSSAVKTNNNGSYVQVFNATTLADSSDASGGTTGNGANTIVSATAPAQTPVSIGISDDSSTEIISGLVEGQQIVTRSIAPQTASTSAPSILNATRPGGNSAGALRGVAR